MSDHAELGREPVNPARRRLLTGVACAASGLSGVMSLTPAAVHAATGPDEADSATPDAWAALRRDFRFSRAAPLNAANLCPALTPVLEQQQRLTEQLSADVDFLNRRDVVRGELAAARRSCANLLGVGAADSLAFVRNTSEANAVIVSGLDLGPGDEVLLWQENHASNYRSWHYRHQRHPFRVRTLALDAATLSDADIVEAFVAALNRRTRVVSFSQLSNISGTCLPVAAICAAVHSYNPDILVHVDGAQSWGSMRVDLATMGCDSYASSAHKWLCGPRGVGVLYVREEWAQRLHPLILGYDFAFDYPQDSLPRDARRFESLGQRDTAACAAVGVAAQWHQAVGPGRIEERISTLTQYTRRALENAGIAVRTPADPQRGHGVVVADLGGRHKSYGAFLALHNAGVAAAFVHGNTVHCTPGGVPRNSDADILLRLCPHIYNSTDDVDAAVAIAARVQRSNFEIIKEVVRFL